MSEVRKNKTSTYNLKYELEFKDGSKKIGEAPIEIESPAELSTEETLQHDLETLTAEMMWEHVKRTDPETHNAVVGHVEKPSTKKA